jgi:HrpA-like RNA helicase
MYNACLCFATKQIIKNCSLHHKDHSLSQLPIESVLPELLSAVHLKQQVVLKAEPGAGKFTHLPLYPSDLKVQDSEPHSLSQFKEKDVAE